MDEKVEDRPGCKSDLTGSGVALEKELATSAPSLAPKCLHVLLILAQGMIDERQC